MYIDALSKIILKYFFKLTLISTTPKVYWFPMGCAPFVPTLLWLINKMAA